MEIQFFGAKRQLFCVIPKRKRVLTPWVSISLEFHFDDFELARKSSNCYRSPNNKKVIKKLNRQLPIRMYHLNMSTIIN